MTPQDFQLGYDLQQLEDTEYEIRRQIVAEAKTWLDTPFEDKQMVKGAGCDCATFIYKVFVPQFTGVDVPLVDYAVQWFLNQREELYMEMLRTCGLKMIDDAPSGPGDIFLVKFGRTFAHGGIVINWPNVIFANPRVRPPRVMINNYYDNPMFAGREVKFFSLFPQRTA